MKPYILFLFVINSFVIFGQEIPKGTSTITVKGIFFQQVVKGLFDSGFHIDKSDSIIKVNY